MLIDSFDLALLKFKRFFDIPAEPAGRVDLHHCTEWCTIVLGFLLGMIFVICFSRPWWCIWLVHELAQCLKTPIAIIDKRRSVDKMSTLHRDLWILVTLKVKHISWLMIAIDTAGTICHAADALAEAQRCSSVFASCTHPAYCQVQHLIIFKNLLLRGLS